MTKLTKADFEPLVNQDFTVTRHDGESIAVKLTDIEEKHHMENYESFHLTFEPVAKAPPMPDDSYIFQNDQLGEATIFISSTPTSDPDPDSHCYESVFNVYVGE